MPQIGSDDKHNAVPLRRSIYRNAAGKGAKAQALKGKLVACMGMGGSYSQHAVVNVEQCMAHHDTTTPEEAASSFVNPLTALGMVKTMKAEGHTGIVHTAAASQLGQMPPIK